jgi:hypothetical protein
MADLLDRFSTLFQPPRGALIGVKPLESGIFQGLALCS